MKTEQMAEQALKEILERTLNGVDAATQFSKENIPDVIEQLLLWHSIESGIFFMIGVIIFITPFAAFRKVRASFNKFGFLKDVGDKMIFTFNYVCISSVPLGIALIVALTHLEWLQIIVAPKLYLLEYAAELVK